LHDQVFGFLAGQRHQLIGAELQSDRDQLGPDLSRTLQKHPLSYLEMMAASTTLAVASTAGNLQEASAGPLPELSQHTPD